MSEKEIWKDVVGYEGRYKGNLYSVDRMDASGQKCGGKALRPIRDSYGYLIVNLCKNGKRKHKKVHRLVTEAFIPNPNSLPQVNHRDEDKTNNNVENLEWCTSKYNANHGTRIKRISDTNKIPVKGVHIETGEEIYLKSMVEGALYGFDPTGISGACSGKQKTHRGYSFQKI